ncbi:MAG: alpha/beta hydrolase [Gammaproteobacteria bacterium]
MKKMISFLFISFIAFYLFAAIYLYLNQRSFIFHPTDVVAHEFDEVVYENEGEQIKVITLNEHKDSAILYFGGNSESLASTVGNIDHLFSDFAGYLINYRGYGGSSGKPDEAGLFSDALHIYDELAGSYEKMYIIGRSLGSGIASYVASKRAVDKLILVTPFDSILNIAQKRYPIFPINYMLKDKFDTASVAENITAEVLVVIAENDQIIPRENTDRLVESLKKVTPKVKVFNDVDHINISQDEDYYPLIIDFLQ